jgi:drug/metabolite transporter (DMT)-like permease
LVLSLFLYSQLLPASAFSGVVSLKNENRGIVAGLVFAVFLWGATNVGTKYMVRSWPPVFVGAVRFLAAGLLFLGVLRWTEFFGRSRAPSREASRRLWFRCGLALAVYIVAFNWALRLTAASHVALYLAASPVWALLFEAPPRADWRSAQRYGAALLALAGVVTLFWPELSAGRTGAIGELFGLSCSVLWTVFGLECRALSQELSGPEVTAHSFWRAGCWLAPFGVWDLCVKPVHWDFRLGWVMAFCVLGGGIVAFGLWNHALRRWTTSKVYLFNNLIPLSTMLWAHFCLGEAISGTFWMAMLLIASGVLLGQARLQSLFGSRWLPEE